MMLKEGDYFQTNPLPSKHDQSCFNSVLMADQITLWPR